MEFVTISLLNGVSYGLLLFMVSAGLTLIFGMMGVLNFAHSSFYMLGAYFGYSIARFSDFWLALLLAPLAVAVLGGLIEKYMLRRVHRHGHAHELLLTFGLVFIIEELVKMFYGHYSLENPMPAALGFSAFELFDLNYPFYRVFIALVAVVMFTAVFLLSRFTRIGLVVRAAVRRPDMVEALGHDVPKVFLGVFAGGAALAGLAGTVAGVFYPTGPTMAHELGVIVFVVVVVGGLGSLEGALLASLLIGVFSSFAVGLDWSAADGLALVGLGDWALGAGGVLTTKLSTLAGAIPFAVMLLVLLLRPAGLMGEKA
ncbi:branched-chain amino acid ABC transporter permease [Marinibaculum pumilum]|uniref:Branched-chain amino acid ABC transporter permease n=1 Tax=Marinibaculum pumilum TaxID=1766165 RepID=A0ABV7L652_9PROT